MSNINYNSNQFSYANPGVKIGCKLTVNFVVGMNLLFEYDVHGIKFPKNTVVFHAKHI